MSDKKQKRQFRELRRLQVARAIRVTWESLESHLKWSVKHKKKEANPEYHSKAVRDYAFVIQALAVELHEIARKDFKRKFTPNTFKYETTE